jgi:pimeloyl-ACP methyl ester carboxylesterase
MPEPFTTTLATVAAGHTATVAGRRALVDSARGTAARGRGPRARVGAKRSTRVAIPLIDAVDTRRGRLHAVHVRVLRDDARHGPHAVRTPTAPPGAGVRHTATARSAKISFKRQSRYLPFGPATPLPGAYTGLPADRVSLSDFFAACGDPRSIPDALAVRCGWAVAGRQRRSRRGPAKWVRFRFPAMRRWSRPSASPNGTIVAAIGVVQGDAIGAIHADGVSSIALQVVAINGHDVAYRRAGEGPVVLLVHGMAGSSVTWNHVMPRLARQFTVVAPDLLGHGESAKPRGEYSLGAHADILRDLLNALGYDRATFVGQSFGGGIVMQLAYQFPERCERLVLVNSGGLGRGVHALLRALTAPGAEQVLALACTPALRAAGGGAAAWFRRVGIRSTPASQEIWRSYESLADADARRAFFRTLRAVVDLGGQSVSAADRLYLSAHIPTLIVWGARDPFIPVRHAFAAHRAIPGSRLEIFDDVGHYPHCEAPERFADVLVDFITSTAPATVSERQWRDLFRPPPETDPGGADATPVSRGPLR